MLLLLLISLHLLPVLKALKSSMKSSISTTSPSSKSLVRFLLKCSLTFSKGKLENLAKDQWWEVKALILILCSSLLLYISKEKEGGPLHTPRQDVVGQSSGDPLNISEPQQRGEEEKMNDSRSPEQMVIPEVQEQHEEMQDIAQMTNQIAFKTYEAEEAFLINLVNNIFRMNSNQNVLKIGMISRLSLIDFQKV